MAQPLIMGIVNITPDSFSDGGLFNDPRVAIDRAITMTQQGADWIDIGGESTRPGATHVPLDQELARVIPVIRELVLADSTINISIDTSKALIAREAIHLGARMINDVTAGLLDPSIFSVAAEFNAPMILMHMNGDPSVMQDAPVYSDVVRQVREHLQSRVAEARAVGVSTVYVDPGIGFGKTLEHNLELLKNLDALTDLADGVVLGISRKRFLGTITGIENPADRDSATALMHALLWQKGAHMIRVHDVPTHVQLRALASLVMTE